jgi:hypothetical protein
MAPAPNISVRVIYLIASAREHGIPHAPGSAPITEFARKTLKMRHSTLAA